ncbi:hypothetical protein [Microbacterium sp. B19]|uniref:hypothetical protein n=1 Tax=Microbacterium sp. B19 TaxID=96765 RepID=UPI00034D17B3|nr:hypothetical protein [Microbacterium sp. B19]
MSEERVSQHPSRRAHRRKAARPSAARRAVSAITAGAVCAIAVFGVFAGVGTIFASTATADDTASSAVTVTAAQQDKALDSAPMPDLAVTVSQTKNLLAQGIRLSWTGGKKSVAPSSSGGQNFLQVFMCWGDDPTDPTRPDRTTCMYGGANSPGATRDAFRNYSLDEIPAEDQQYSALTSVAFLPPYTGIPFVARDGARVDGIKTDPKTGAKTVDESVNLNVNPFFTSYSTNEISWVGSGDDGSGAVSFEVQTAAQAPALGCGNPVVSKDGKTTTGASCWLVVLPRGTADNGSSSINQSGLFIESWRHALAVRLDFTPLGTRCPEGTAERLLAGSELTSNAIASWQPVVCNSAGAAVYSVLTVPESDALTAAATTEDAPLALTSYARETSGTDPLTYAPIALTGVTISLSIDRHPDPFKDVPQKYVDAARTPFTSVNLTPRLLAKLLSYSYRSSLPNGANIDYLNKTNPDNITKDPDFLAVNDPEWGFQNLTGPAIADVIVPQGRTDSARAVWAYIASDPEAAAFLAGKPDPWGMVVNPWYSTDADTNPTKTAFSVDRDDFPKADPVEFTPSNAGVINLVTWRPFAADLSSVAYLTLRGDGQGPGFWDANSIPPKYGKLPRMLPGNQALLGLTSAAAARRYQVVTASLRNPAGKFVAPDDTSIAAAAPAMAGSKTNPSVDSFDFTSDAARAATAAYPLAMPVYAAARPSMKDANIRRAYAQFIRYAVGPGQKRGPDAGQLPDGYVPLPADWTTQAQKAADAIESGPVAPSPQPSSYIPSQSAPVKPAAAAAAVSAPAAAAPAAPAAESPTAASGAASAALSGGKTPDDPDIGAITAAVPASALAGLAGALAVPLITRLRRRVT